VDELATWRAQVKQARDELLRGVGGDPRNITFAKLAEKKFPIKNQVPINIPGLSTTTVDNAVSHIYYYLSAYFDNTSYTMEHAMDGLALRKAEAQTTGEEDLGYAFLANVEAALSGQNTVDISNIQNYPLFAFYLVLNTEGDDALSEGSRRIKPLLIQEELVGPGGQ
jgi:hypothetical protein